jgi:hypothetical protein
MDVDNLSINLGERLDMVADFYKISRDPKDYLLIPARANSIGRFNANLDGWTYPEITVFRPEFGCRTYATYINKPHFVEHKSDRQEIARGVILDSHINMSNAADDNVKRAVMETIGFEPVVDAFVEVVVAMDKTKDPILARAYSTGAIKTFSMGADVEATQCNICENVATNNWSFCDHIKQKYSKKSYRMADGTKRVAGELCLGTVFQELSAVADPADKSAVIQDGLLNVLKKASCSDAEIQELISFTARYAKVIPESLAKLINSHLEQRFSNVREN